jgi:hypothetical protein
VNRLGVFASNFDKNGEPQYRSYTYEMETVEFVEFLRDFVDALEEPPPTG